MINVLRKLGGFLVIAGLLVLLSFVRSAQETKLVQNVNIKINDLKNNIEV